MGNTEDRPIEIDVSDLTEELLETGIEPEEPAAEEPPVEVEPEAEPVEDDPVVEEQPKEQKTAPLSATIKLERENRKLRRELAEMRASQIVPETPEEQPKEPVLSPLEKWEQENAELLSQDPSLPIPASVQIADSNWQRDHTAQQNVVASQRQYQQAIAQSLAVAKSTMTAEEKGEGLDFESVVMAGAPFLSSEDKNIIRASGKQAGDWTYRLCLKRAHENQVEDIAEALRARRQSLAVPKSPTNKPKKEAVPTRQEVLGRGSVHRSLGIRYPA